MEEDKKVDASKSEAKSVGSSLKGTLKQIKRKSIKFVHKVGDVVDKKVGASEKIDSTVKGIKKVGTKIKRISRKVVNKFNRRFEDLKKAGHMSLTREQLNKLINDTQGSDMDSESLEALTVIANEIPQGQQVNIDDIMAKFEKANQEKEEMAKKLEAAERKNAETEARLEAARKEADELRNNQNNSSSSTSTLLESAPAVVKVNKLDEKIAGLTKDKGFSEEQIAKIRRIAKCACPNIVGGQEDKTEMVLLTKIVEKEALGGVNTKDVKLTTAKVEDKKTVASTKEESKEKAVIDEFTAKIKARRNAVGNGT